MEVPKVGIEPTLLSRMELAAPSKAPVARWHFSVKQLGAVFTGPRATDVISLGSPSVGDNGQHSRNHFYSQRKIFLERRHYAFLNTPRQPGARGQVSSG